MRAVERTISGNLRGKPLMGLLALAFALIAAYEEAEFIISGDAISPILKAKSEVKSADLALAAQQPRWVT